MSRITRTLTRLAPAALAGAWFAACPVAARGQARAQAAPPASYATPSAAAPGRVTDVTLVGGDLRGATGLWTSFPCEATPQAGDDAAGAKLQLKVPAEAPVGIGALRVVTPSGISGLRLFLIDDLPTVTENGGNSAAAAAQVLSLPAAVEGACDATGSDFYRFSGKAGDRVAVEVVARRLGSPLDPLVRLLDPTGRELVWCDDSPGAAPDGRFEHVLTADGDYVVEVRDTTYQGGGEFRYRLRLSLSPLKRADYLPPEDMRRPAVVKEAEPNDSPEAASPAELPASIEGKFDRPRDVDVYRFDARKGDRLLFRARTRSLAFPCDAVLRLEKQDGARLAESNAATPADDPVLTHTFAADGPCRLTVRELNRLGGPGHDYRVEVTPDPGFSLAAEVDKVDASPSGEFELKVTCARRDHKGPIRLAVEGLAGELKLGGDVIKEGQTETRLKVKLPETSASSGAGASFRVVGRATISGREYEATASTAAALKKLYPLMLYPPPEFDGLIGLGVKRP